jgi:PAS domain S-box-containing protein
VAWPVSAVSLKFAGEYNMDRKRCTFSINEAGGNLDANAILDVLSDGISIQDTNMRVIYQNEAHKALVGDHAGEYCFSAYQQRETVCEGCHLVQSFQDAQVHRRETATPLAGGMRVEIISTPLMDDQGRIVAGIEAVRDITVRKQAEERLLQHRAAMEAGMDGMAILDDAGHYLYLNQAHAALYGYESPEQLIGKSWKTLYHDDELQRFETVIMPAFFLAGSWRGEATGTRRDGSIFPQELSLAVLPGGGIACVVRDISDRRRADEEIRSMNEGLERRAAELTAANHELESYSYSLSHDIRGYLSRISLAVQLLEEEYLPAMDPDGAHLVHAIQAAEEEMDGLIHAMLELFRTNRTELLPGMVDLSALAHDVAVSLREGDPSWQRSVVIQPGLVIEGDRAMLRIVLENLFGNAWKFTARTVDARIEFGTTIRDGREVLFVRDNGAGFPMEGAGKLFKPFQRLHSSQEYPGTGIGLATVQRIILRHQGQVWGEGETGGGATFYFTLPLIQASGDNES